MDLERRETRRKYLPAEVLTHFLGGRGANMWLLYNLLQEDKDALDPEVPLIFGAGVLTSVMPSATRGNFTSKSPEEFAGFMKTQTEFWSVLVKQIGAGEG